MSEGGVNLSSDKPENNLSQSTTELHQVIVENVVSAVVRHRAANYFVREMWEM